MLHILMLDTLEHQTLLSVQECLKSVSSLIALQMQPLAAVKLGLCGVLRQSPKNVRLHVRN